MPRLESEAASADVAPANGAASREATFRLAAIVESSHDAIVSKTLDGIIRTWNRGAQLLFGYAAPEIIGRPIKTLIPPGLQAEEDRILTRIRAGEHVDHYETQRRRKDGTLVDVSLSVSPIRDDRGRIIGASKIARDITERNRMQGELRRINEGLEARVRERTEELEVAVRELEAFNYTVSHDLRTPLRAVRGFASLLLEEVHDQVARCRIQYILDGADDMSRTIETLLRLSHINATQIETRPVDVSTMAEGILDRLARRDPARRVDATIEPGLVADADAALLQVALENLIGNAWKFTGKNRQGHIHVGRCAREGRQAFVVEDDGVGFSASDADRLFQPFQRLRPAEFEGNGIGLAIVRRILHAHGGGMAAEGEPGRRAAFYIWF